MKIKQRMMKWRRQVSLMLKNETQHKKILILICHCLRKFITLMYFQS